ncbi:hypothetical protein hrd7_25430 [Leptolinea sp. HRD-7]|nr:hypothetical protein hrd7_25430 [Leptolinea sp. HRD-7]
MGAKNEDLSSKLELDTSNYKAGLTELNRQIRVLESGFRATAAGMEDWSATATGLEARNKTLTQQIDLQRQKVEGLSKVYEQMAADEKTSQKAKDEMQISINKENEKLARLQVELNGNKKALDDMGDGAKNAGKGVKELGDREDETAGKSANFKSTMEGLASGLKTIGTVVAGVAAAVGVVGGAVGKMVLDSAKAGDDLSETAIKVSLTTTQLQELGFVAKQVGTDTDTVTGAMGKMIRNMKGAKDGTGEAADAFRKLGIPVTDAAGNLRNSQDVWADAMTALRGMSNETERDATAMSLFGKSAREMNPLIETSKEEFDRLVGKAHELGAVVADKDVQALGELNDTLDGLKDGLKGTSMTVAAAFLPAFKGLAGKASGYMKDLATIVSGSDGDLGKMASGIGGLVSQIVADISSQGPSMLTGGLSILQGIINGLMTNLPTLLPAVIQMLMSIVNFIIQNLPTLITAAIQIITALATGIAQALPTLIPAMVGAIPIIIEALLTNLPLLIGAALQILIALAQGIVAALPILIEQAPVILNSLIDAITTSLPMIGDAALKIIFTLANGINDNLPEMKKSASELIKSFVNGVKEINNKLLDVGKNIVDGVWQGIQNNYQKFYNNIKDFFGGIVNVVMDVLDIHSPAGKLIWPGEMVSEGFGLGIFKRLEVIKSKLRTTLAGMSLEMAGVSSFGGGYGGGQSTYNFYGSVSLVGAAGQSIGQMIEAKRF